jgi:phenylacetate-coenzyme A ligase PaaK-like adenylate-forming protein
MRGNDHCTQTQNDQDCFEEFIYQSLMQQFYGHFESMMVCLIYSIVVHDLIILFQQNHLITLMKLLDEDTRIRKNFSTNFIK